MGAAYYSNIHNTSAESIVDNSLFTVEVVPNLSITLPESTTLKIKSSTDGTFGSTDLTAAVDTSDGYTLSMYATKPTELNTPSTERTTSLINTANTNNTINTIIADITEEQFSNKNNKQYNNQWGYKLNNSSDDKFHPITTDNMEIGSSIEGGSFSNTVTFGTRVDDTLPYGSYATVLNFIATTYVKPITHTITLKPGAGITSIQLDEETACTNATEGCPYVLDEGSTHNLTATVTNGYNFTSWSSSHESGSFSSPTTSTTTFTVGEGDATITANGEANGLNGMTECTLSSGATTTLTDTRDNNSYTISKLADGKCWMLQNLRLSGSRTLTTADSNVKQDRTWNPTNGTTADYTTLYTYQPTGTAKIYSNGSWSNTTSATDMGMLYNYAAATAGTITGNSNTTEASEDICPKGWRLPTQSEYNALYTAYSSNYTNFNNAFNTVLSGYFNGSLYNVGTSGSFWSSTPDPSDAAGRYNLVVYTSSVDPASSGTRYHGLSVRCVLK